MTQTQLHKSPGTLTQGSSRQKIISIPLILFALFVLALGIISLFTGVYDLSAENGKEMFFITRVPRMVSLMLTGAAMALSGLVMQLITQNRFVEPTTTGTIEWAGLGLILVYVLVPTPSMLLRMFGAIVFAFIGTIVFFMLLRRIEFKLSLIVPIIGIMLGSVISAVSTFVGLFFQMSQSLEVWFAGSFAPIQIGQYEFLWFIILITLAIFFLADRLTVAGLGEDVAANLGLNYKRITLFGTALIALATGVVAAVVGYIPFLGLIVPNIVSKFRGDNLRSNLPWVWFSGMAIITLCDIFARTIIMPFEVPVSLVLGTVGAVIFIYLLMKDPKAVSK